jgi:MtN3 and saliva related transmembrane protein
MGVEMLGFVAGFLTTVGTVPQVWRLFRMRSAHEISVSFVAMFSAGVACWLAYGVALGLESVIFWNGTALMLQGAMIYAKVRWGR